MNRANIFLLVILLSLFCSKAIAGEGTEVLNMLRENSFERVSDGYLVEFSQEAHIQGVSGQFNAMPLVNNAVLAHSRGNRLSRTVLVRGRDAEKLRDEYTRNPQLYKQWIKHIEPNLILKTQFQPNDPYLNQSTIFTDGTIDSFSIPNMNLNGVSGGWELTRGLQNVVVAVVDTGLDKTHPDISSKVWSNPNEIPGNGIDDDSNGFIDDVSGWDFIGSDNNSDDDNGHGTHVSGLIAAETNNSIGIAGACPNCRVFGVKVLSGAGSGSIAGIVQGILYAASMNVDVINMSLGAKGISQALNDAINIAFDSGTVVVVAAGNSADAAEFYTPAGIRRAVTIAAADPHKNNASFSNFGIAIDVAAPGGGNAGISIPSECDPRYNVISLLAAHSGYPSSPTVSPCILGGNYVRIAGTSMASPNAAGIAGLVRSLYPSFSADQVASAIKNGGDNLNNFELLQGHGHIDSVGALRSGLVAEVQITKPDFMPAKDEESVTFGGIINNPSVGSLSNYALKYRPLNDEEASWLVLGENFPLSSDGSFTFQWDRGASTLDGEYLFRLEATIRRNSESTTSSDYGIFRLGPSYFSETDPSMFTPGSTFHSAVFDVDGDGDRDIVQGNLAHVGASSLEAEQNYLFAGDGLGGFADETAQRMPVLRDYTTYVLKGDFDKDGDIDLFHVNFNLSGSIPHKILLNDGKGHFSIGGSISFQGFMCGFAGDVGDVDKDGDLDIILSQSCLGGNILLINDGRANFVDVSESAGFDVGSGNFHGAQLVDVNNDGFLDAIFSSTSGKGALLLINNKNLTFRDATSQVMVNNSGQSHIAVADLNKDGYMDFYAGRGNLYINRGRSQAGWFDHIALNEKEATGADFLFNYELGDLDRDGDADLIGFGQGVFGVGLNQMSETGVVAFVDHSFEFAPKKRTLDTSEYVGLADADGDGDLDVMVHIQVLGEGYLQIYWNNLMTVGDVNGDGLVTIIDALLVARASAGLITLTPEQIKRADINYDGRISIIDAQWISKKAANPRVAFPAPPVI